MPIEVNKVVARYNGGILGWPWRGVALTGRLVAASGTNTYRCADGKTEQIQGVETGESKSQVTIIAETLRLLASVAVCQGADAVARPLYEESLTIVREFDYKLYIASCLEALANAIADQGQPARHGFSIWRSSCVTPLI